MATDDRIRETIERLKALALVGDSHENLSAICSALMGRLDYGWTIGACASLREVLIDTLEQLDPDEWADSYLDEVGLVRLPKDADGEYIHIGDRMEDNERVARIVLTDDSLEPSVYLEKLPSVLHEHFCHEVHHYHKPTVESVLQDMVNDMICAFVSESGRAEWLSGEMVAKYAKLLREVMDND